MYEKIISFLIKPLNPVDLDFVSRMPRNQYNFLKELRS